MPTIKKLKENLEVISMIENITRTYQEIANLRMNQIKEKVLINREFFKELLNTYQTIKAIYFFSLKKEENKKVIFRRTKKEKLIIFLSANQPLYGNLIWEVWKLFQKYLKNYKADFAIVGKIGKYFAEMSGLNERFYYFDLDDIQPEREKVAEILDFIKNYQNIIVFHGKYEKGLIQKPIKTEISGELSEKEKIKEIKNYIFEPSIEAILEFFESEIIAVLFNLTLLEHQLARWASRVLAMDQATEKAKNLKRKLKITENKLKREIKNKEQIEIFSNLLYE